MPNGIYNQAITIEEAIKRFFAKYNLEEKLKEASLTRTSAFCLLVLVDCPEIWTDEDHKLCESYQ